MITKQGVRMLGKQTNARTLPKSVGCFHQWGPLGYPVKGLRACLKCGELNC